MATAYDTRYGLFPPRTPDPLPVLLQAFDVNAFKDIPDKLPTITVPMQGRGLQGAIPEYEKIAPEFDQYADRSLALGMGGGRQIESYTVPTDKKFQDKPLVAKYDAKGNFIQLMVDPQNALTPDPNQPNILATPVFNKTGGITNYGVYDANAQDNGSFGSFIRDVASEFGPMILAGLGANFAAGNLGSLFGSGAGAAGTGLTLGGGGLGLSAGGSGLGITAGSAGAGAIGGSLGSTLAGITTGIGAGTALGAIDATSGLLNSGTGLTAGGSGLGLNAGTGTGLNIASTTGSGLGITAGSAGAGTIGAGLGETLAGITTGIGAGAGAGAGFTVTPSILQSIANATGIDVDTLKTFGPAVIQGLASATGSVLTSNQATDAATTQANAQIRAAQIAADAARFRPVGVTTRFGTSNFTTDAAGNVVTAGYTPSAEITGYQDRLRTLAGQGLTDVEAARAAYQPLTGAAQSLFGLGQSYLAKTPEQAAADYISKQQALLAPSQQNQLALLQNQLQQQGRGGLSVAQGGNLGATTPEMQAYYNSLAQSNLALAANADQEAQNRIRFGAGLFDTGANLQNRFYSGQTAAYAPFTTAIDTSSGLERLAQQPLDLSTSIGQRVSTANANVGNLTSQGIINAAATMAPANAYSAAGNLFTGAAQSPVFSNAVNRAFGNTQQSTQQMFTFNPATGQYIPVQNAII